MAEFPDETCTADEEENERKENDENGVKPEVDLPHRSVVFQPKDSEPPEVEQVSCAVHRLNAHPPEAGNVREEAEDDDRKNTAFGVRIPNGITRSERRTDGEVPSSGHRNCYPGAGRNEDAHDRLSVGGVDGGESERRGDGKTVDDADGKRSGAYEGIGQGEGHQTVTGDTLDAPR